MSLGEAMSISKKRSPTAERRCLLQLAAAHDEIGRPSGAHDDVRLSEQLAQIAEVGNARANLAGELLRMFRRAVGDGNRSDAGVPQRPCRQPRSLAHSYDEPMATGQVAQHSP